VIVRDVVKLVAFREIRQRLRARSFAVFTALLCIGIIALGLLNSILNDDSPTSYEVATVGELPGTFTEDVDDLAATLGVEVEVTTIASRAEAETAVSDDDVDAAVDPATGDVIWPSEPVDELSSIVNGAWQAAEAREAASAAGLDAAQTEALLSPAPLNEVLLDPDDDDDGLGILIGMASAILLFISISTFGGYVLMGVVEEKSTGVVEILLSHVKPHQLLTGKVLGIGTVAMIQFAAAVAAGLVSLWISGASVPSDIWVGLPATILWFVAGFLLYSTLFALAGSFVSRQEDAQGAAAPVSMVFIAAYLTVFALGGVPDATVTRVLSVLPPFAPLLMPLRMVTGSASMLEITVAAILLVAATYAMLRLAGAVFGRTLLHRGSRLQWRQGLRMQRP
jgi:ABC-2 type transport system permease protein